MTDLTDRLRALNDEFKLNTLGVRVPEIDEAIRDLESQPVIQVHHHDMEAHATSFNEGYDTAVAHMLADNPLDAQNWLERKEAEAAATALEEVGARYKQMHGMSWCSMTGRDLLRRAKEIRESVK